MIFSLDQNRWSLASAEIDVAGDKMLGVQSLAPKEELTPTDVYGNGPVPVGRTRGIYKGSAELSILLVEFRAIIQKLGNGFGEKTFNIGATYIEINGDGVMPIEITGCRIATPDLSDTNDGKATVVKVGLSIITPIFWDGLQIINVNNGVATIGASFGSLAGALSITP